VCNSALFRRRFTWGLLTSLAWDDFGGVSTEPGVYCLRLVWDKGRNLGTTISGYKRTALLKAIKRKDEESHRLFRQVGLAREWGWDEYGQAIDRVDRLRRIEVTNGTLSCPILYFGSTNSLHRRLDELAFGGHTVNHAVWALLLGGWQLYAGWKEAQAYQAEEQRLKTMYMERHASNLPPLMDR